jgi:hypothetical protein
MRVIDERILSQIFIKCKAEIDHVVEADESEADPHDSVAGQLKPNSLAKHYPVKYA